MAGYVWFQYANVREKVSLEGINDVADVREAIKKKLAPNFDEYAPANFIIRATLFEDKAGRQATNVLDGDVTLESILETLRVVNKPIATSIRFFVDVLPKFSAGKLDIHIVIQPPSKWGISFRTMHIC